MSGKGVLLYICYIFSEYLFLGTTLSAASVLSLLFWFTIDLNNFPELVFYSTKSFLRMGMISEEIQNHVSVTILLFLMKS